MPSTKPTMKMAYIRSSLPCLGMSIIPENALNVLYKRPCPSWIFNDCQSERVLARARDLMSFLSSRFTLLLWQYSNLASFAFLLWKRELSAYNVGSAAPSWDLVLAYTRWKQCPTFCAQQTRRPTVTHATCKLSFSSRNTWWLPVNDCQTRSSPQSYRASPYLKWDSTGSVRSNRLLLSAKIWYDQYMLQE